MVVFVVVAVFVVGTVIGIVGWLALKNHKNGNDSPSLPHPPIPKIVYVSDQSEIMLVYATSDPQSVDLADVQIEPSDYIRNLIIQSLGKESNSQFAKFIEISNNFSTAMPTTSPSWCGKTGFVLDSEQSIPTIVAITSNPGPSIQGCLQGLNIQPSSSTANGFVIFGKRPIASDEYKAVPPGFKIAPYNSSRWSRFE